MSNEWSKMSGTLLIEMTDFLVALFFSCKRTMRSHRETPIYGASLENFSIGSFFAIENVFLRNAVRPEDYGITVS